ncbi:MAG TPA: family 16 glycoside hydrolase, partial [Candidatus Baltobacteraceae bacterium]|nr:family 16 glycoside hydrolase [Candidatus Baltobacteraceae bacterium]
MKSAARITIFSAILFCFALAGCLTSKAQDSTNAVELFNGKDFTGWTFYMRSNAAPEKTWSISDGMVHCTGRPTGYMRTLQTYSNFIVTAEWRLATNYAKAV